MDLEIAQALWQSGDFKGAQTSLEPWHKSFLKDHDGLDELEWRDEMECPILGEAELGPQRELAQYSDFIEVCGGSGAISDELAKHGFTVGPIVDISYSPAYDMMNLRAVGWLLWLVQNGRVRSLALEPPCASFSPAARPVARSFKVPRGFNQKLPKVLRGNSLAFSCLAIMLAASKAHTMALLEQPRRSKMAWLREWKFLKSLPTFRETFTASCSFGCPHLKEFRFLTCNMVPEGICFPCTRDHQHAKIEGSLTKQSAAYCRGLAEGLARLFAKHLRRDDQVRQQVDLRTDGFEAPLVNELALRARWEVGGVWRWRGQLTHINILELSSVFQVARKAARQGLKRFSLLIDSFVALRSVAKGRSGSRALAPLLRKIMALAVAYDIYLSGHFCPTRLNPSDDPSRSAPLRSAVSSPSILDVVLRNGAFGVYDLASLPRLKRWAANWVRLFLGASALLQWVPMRLRGIEPRRRSGRLPVSFPEFCMDFDATLGYPGEGPVVRLGQVCLMLGLACCHGMRPRNVGDQSCAARRAGRPLEYGRPVLAVTRSNRAKLLEAFAGWLEAQGIFLQMLLDESFGNPERLVTFLVRYGSELYDAGRPYSHYAETINAVGAAKPTVRRLLSGAWDLAFSWLREEPYEHHVACPFQIMLAILSVSLVWGWPQVAGVVALSWGAVCRIGEVLAARRADLVLPCDVDFTIHVAMVRVQEPKTRFRAARHQIRKLECLDLVALVSLVFRRLSPGQRLWPASAQLMRTRFRPVLEALKLPVSPDGSGRTLDLGSLRPEGATRLLAQTEDSELVRRRGRWLSHRTMEIYLQEVGAAVFFPRLPSETKAWILEWPGLFLRCCES